MLSFGLGVAELVLVRLLAVLLVDGLSFVHTVIYDVIRIPGNVWVILEKGRVLFMNKFIQWRVYL